MKTLTITVRDILPGDYVVAAKATVEGTQRIASLVIVDFTDRTATAPIPGNAPVVVQRA